MKLKTNGQRNPVTKPNPLAVAIYACVAQTDRAAPSYGQAAGSNPATGTTLNSLVSSANYSRGLASGKPKAGFIPTAIVRFEPEESKFQSDLSFVQNRV